MPAIYPLVSGTGEHKYFSVLHTAIATTMATETTTIATETTTMATETTAIAKDIVSEINIASPIAMASGTIFVTATDNFEEIDSMDTLAFQTLTEASESTADSEDEAIVEDRLTNLIDHLSARNSGASGASDRGWLAFYADLSTFMDFEEI